MKKTWKNLCYVSVWVFGAMAVLFLVMAVVTFICSPFSAESWDAFQKSSFYFLHAVAYNPWNGPLAKIWD